MKRILAIDPGTTESGFVVWDGTVVEAGIIPNEEMLERIIGWNFGRCDLCAIEMIASQGMAVGTETFETVFWIGRFYERVRLKVRTERVLRRDIKLHLCGTARAKDANVSQALKDRYGPVGSKNHRGPLYGIAGHKWAALAVASFAADTLGKEAR